VKNPSPATVAFAVLLALLIALPAATTATAKSKKPPVVIYAPDGKAPVAASLAGDTWVYDTAGVVVQVRQLDDAERQAYLEEKAGAFTDPFARTDYSTSGFLTFAVEIESRISGSLVYQPQNCRLITNKKDTRYPLDLPSIEAAYGLMDREVPPAYHAARPALFDGERVFESGDRASGLLVYRGIDPNSKSFVIEIVLTTPQGEVLEFKVAYRRLKKKELEKSR
jgi:hypothetical protein